MIRKDGVSSSVALQSATGVDVSKTDNPGSSEETLQIFHQNIRFGGNIIKSDRNNIT